MSMMSDYEEDLDDFPVENKDRAVESLVGAYRRQVNGQQEVGSRRRFHHFSMDPRPGLSMRS